MKIEKKSLRSNILSRRKLLGSMLSWPAVVGVIGAAAPHIAFADAMCADADDNAGLRSSLHYVEASPSLAEKCQECAFFSGPNGNCGQCQILNGPVSKTGHCDSWSPKK